MRRVGRKRRTRWRRWLAQCRSEKGGPDEAMLARVEAEVDRKMDNGVRINLAFRERARRAEEEEGEARRAVCPVEEQAAAVPIGATRGTEW